MANQKWNNNEIQFARLLTEIIATQDKLNIDSLCHEMGLQKEDVDELFDRANKTWEASKKQVLDQDKSFSSIVEMFGEKRQCKVEIWHNNQPVNKQSWDNDLYIESQEDYYSLNSPRLRGKLTRVIKREDFINGTPC